MANQNGKKIVSGTIVRFCNCVHAFQDWKYGNGNRVMNLTAKGATCTVCGATRLN